MTVEKIQRAIARISGDTIYQVILAVMLMGSYESVMYFSRESTSSLPPDAVGSRFWGIICHEKGAAALLIARRERGFAANTELDKAIRKKCLHIIILRGGPILDCLKDGRSWGEDGHELQLDSLMIRVLSLRHKSMCFLRDMDAVEPETVDKARSIAMEAYTLDYDLASWPLGLPQNWGFQISRTHSQPSSNVADASVGIPTHNYPSICHATIWNQYRALRLITNAIQKRALVALQPLLEGSFLDTNIKRCQDNINDLAVDLCSGIKFLIAYRTPNRGSEATALHHMPYPSVATLLAWPLTVAVSVDAVQPPEKTWLKSALKVVSLSLGHSLLESVADQGEFKF
ncbi:hypothetical protein TrVGV298_008874 [Trichoderma virens]|nr:hypothetical protein TrVGV298_008874 [Trichoderma virens]